MHRPLLALALATILMPMAHAGTADDPEWADPADDQAISGGGPLTSAIGGDDFADVDLLAAYIQQENETLVIVVTSSGDPAAATTMLTLATASTDASFRFPDEPAATEVNVTLDGIAITEGPANATATGPGLTVTIPMADLGMVSGDELSLLSLSRSRSTSGSIPVLDAGEQASDAFEGTARPFQTASTPVVADARLAFDAAVLTVSNTGSHPDVFTLEGHEPALRLLPGQSATVTATDNATAFSVSSLRGASVQLTVPAPLAPEAAPEPAPATPQRVPIPAGLTWLTPAATGWGLEDLAGRGAEATLLGAVLLAVILASVILVRRALARVTPRPPEPQEEPVAADEPIIEASSMLDTRQMIIPGKPTLVLDDLQHSSEAPSPGAAVESTITLENKGVIGARVRAELLLDGVPVRDSIVAIPGRQRARIRIPWQAGTGPNQPLIRVYPA